MGDAANIAVVGLVSKPAEPLAELVLSHSLGCALIQIGSKVKQEDSLSSTHILDAAYTIDASEDAGGSMVAVFNKFVASTISSVFAGKNAAIIGYGDVKSREKGMLCMPGTAPAFLYLWECLHVVFRNQA